MEQKRKRPSQALSLSLIYKIKNKEIVTIISDISDMPLC